MEGFPLLTKKNWLENYKSIEKIYLRKLYLCIYLLAIIIPPYFSHQLPHGGLLYLYLEQHNNN